MAKNQKRGVNMVNAIGYAVGFIVLLRAVYTDVTRGKIENQILLIGYVSGVILAAIRDGPGSVWNSVKMSGLILVSLFLLYVIKGLGAGDIKLLCVMACLYPTKAIWIVVLSFLVGGIIVVGRMIFRFIRNRPIYIRHETIPFSVPVFISAGILIGMVGR